MKITQKDLDNNSSGMFTQRMINDTEKMASFIGWDGLEHLRHIFANVGALFTTLIINRQVFLYYLMVSIIFTVLYNAKTKRKGKIDVLFRNSTEKVSGLIGELVRGVRDIKMLNAQNSFMIKLEENITEQ